MRNLLISLFFLLTPWLVGSADPQLFLVIDHHFEESLNRTNFSTYLKAARLHIVTAKSEEKGFRWQKQVRPIFIDDFSVERPPKKMNFLRNEKVNGLLGGLRLQGFANYIQTLTKFENRSIRDLNRKEKSGNEKVQSWLVHELKGYGLKVEKKCYRKWKFENECNVLAVHQGEEDEIILAQAHMDDVGHQQAGADDNASGTAGLLLMARELSKKKYKKTLHFLFTNGEEVGLNGSRAYVKDMKNIGRLGLVQWTVNMDMIAYNQNGIFEIETNKEFKEQAQWYAQMAHQYTNLQPEITIPAWGSDHETFLDEGIASFLTIEDWQTKTPCYHRACDKAETLNIDYAKQIIRLNIAVMAQKAEVLNSL